MALLSTRGRNEKARHRDFPAPALPNLGVDGSSKYILKKNFHYGSHPSPSQVRSMSTGSLSNNEYDVAESLGINTSLPWNQILPWNADTQEDELDEFSMFIERTIHLP